MLQPLGAVAACDAAGIFAPHPGARSLGRHRSRRSQRYPLRLTPAGASAGITGQLERVYETDMAEGLKAMALEGHGLAFLPHSAVREELHAQRLVSALPADAHAGEALQLRLSVRAYRARPAGKDAEQSRAQALWSYLQAQEAQDPKERGA